MIVQGRIIGIQHHQLLEMEDVRVPELLTLGEFSEVSVPRYSIFRRNDEVFGTGSP